VREYFENNFGFTVAEKCVLRQSRSPIEEPNDEFSGSSTLKCILIKLVELIYLIWLSDSKQIDVVLHNLHCNDEIVINLN
jgi:hypothetical protein